jgi:chromosome segregation ATPase
MTIVDANSNSGHAIPKNQSMSTKELHDRWMELMPEGAKHDPDDCVLCQLMEENDTATRKVGDFMSDKDYTKEDMDAAIAAAVKPFEDRLSELEGAKAEEALEAKIAEARTELETKVAELQTELDVKVAECEAAKKDAEDLKAFLTAEDERIKEEAAKETRKTERLDKVKENAKYSDEYLAAHADRWAEQSDEEFAGFIADLEAAGVTGDKSDKDDKIPTDNKLTTSRETASKTDSALSGLLELRRAGIDARRI